MVADRCLPPLLSNISMLPSQEVEWPKMKNNDLDGRGFSESSTDFQEKQQEHPNIQKGEIVPEGQSERVTAVLQVVGAFFLMFNSWYDTCLVACIHRISS